MLSTGVGWIVALAATALAAVIAAAPAQAQVANPGPVELTVEGGIISTNGGAAGNGLDFPLGGDGDPITLSGDVAADGTLSVPAANVSFPPTQIDDPVETLITITATDDVTGSIDPVTGAANADLSLEVLIEPGPGLAECAMSVDVALSTEGPGGVPYDSADGTFTIADGTFAIPATTPVSDPASLCPIVDETLGLPAPAGTNLARFETVSDPILQPEAGPEPFEVAFNHGILDLGSNDPIDFLSDDEPATFDGEFDPVTGEVTVPAGNVVLPSISVTTPAEATITTTPDEDVTGTFDPATGELDLDMVVTSVTEALGAECAFEGFEWNLSTANTEPFEGAPFADGLDGEGAIAAGWEDIPPVTTLSGDPATCDLVRTLGAGPGGLLYERVLGPPPAAAIRATVAPRLRRVGPGVRQVLYRFRVKNRGDAPSGRVQMCARAPRARVALRGPTCRAFNNVNPGQVRKRPFRFRVKKAARGKLTRIRFVARGSEFDRDQAVARLRVRR